MLIIKAVHIISMVAWFAGLFYLPRLFVYHADAVDKISIERFKLMERRLYYAITWPAAIFTTVLGISLLTYNWGYYLKSGWMHAKLALVVLLWAYHLTCGHFVKQFAGETNIRNARFYRVFNEVPTVLLVLIVFAVVLKPQL